MSKPGVREGDRSEQQVARGELQFLVGWFEYE